MVSGFDPNQFAVIFDEILGGKKSLTCDTMEVDRLSCLPDDIVHHILSFLDAKCAVQTSILSKIWRYRWTHVRSLNLECVSNKITNFKNFVLENVLPHRKPLNLRRLRFHLKGVKSQPLMRMLSSYAISNQLEELDTNVISFLPWFHLCRTLRTLKLGLCSRDLRFT